MHTELTKDQISFLKKARHIYFSVRRNEDGAFVGHVEAIQEDRDNCSVARMEITTRGLVSGGNRANTSIAIAGFCEVWQTVLAFVKPGDSLGLRFEANGFRPLDEKYNDVNLDVLYITVERNNKFYKFLLDVHLTKEGHYRIIQ